jgi:hypothetical protein
MSILPCVRKVTIFDDDIEVLALLPGRATKKEGRKSETTI